MAGGLFHGLIKDGLCAFHCSLLIASKEMEKSNAQNVHILNIQFAVKVQ